MQRSNPCPTAYASADGHGPDVDVLISGIGPFSLGRLKLLGLCLHHAENVQKSVGP